MSWWRHARIKPNVCPNVSLNEPINKWIVIKAKKQLKGTTQRRELLPSVPENPFVQEKNKNKQTRERTIFSMVEG